MNELTEPVRVTGAATASRAILLARTLKDAADAGHDSRLLVLCRDDDTAAELAADVVTLSESVLGRSVRVIHFPAWEQSPYSPISPSIRIRLARIAALSALSEGKGPLLVVSSLIAANQVTIPVGTLADARLELKIEDSVGSRELLVRKLIEAGYLRMDTVEDPGTFAVRGDIVDIFPPGREAPWRVELFGDIIEKIREFDPKTQRAASKDAPTISAIRVSPAREVLITAKNSNQVREQVKQRADDLGVSRSRRDPVLASIQDGVYPDHSDVWAPFVYETPATLWDHLSSQLSVVWDDELSCLQDWDRFLSDQKVLAADPSTGVIAPAPEALFLSGPSVDRRIREATRLFLDRVELATLGAIEPDEPTGPVDREADVVSTRHRVAVNANSDLSGGSRHSLGDLETKFQLWMKQGFRILALASTPSQLERIRFLFEERSLPCRPLPEKMPEGGNGLETPSLIHLGVGTVSGGFRWPAEGLVVLNESEILGTKPRRRQRRETKKDSPSKDWAGLQALADLSVGDAVVHVDHGIGRYQGLVRLSLSGAPSDFLQLEYANKDKLYLPVYRLNVIQKYAGSGEGVALDRLGSQQFAKAKERVKDAVKTLAIDLVKLYAERKVRPGVVFSPRDAEYREFESQFPFDETPDQLKAIDDTLADLESGKVMDRLVCGDVGYGKTEVAIRAAFRAVSDGKQVVVLVPTTVLAHQHEQSFKTRLKDYPVTVESVSRFKNAKDQKVVIERLAAGKLDVVIGTHRLFSKDVKFHDLGLIIVDEEHRFGVEHKERLKALKSNTHVLTLTATPIPRTLHMALSGLRDISLINTPPIDRLPIRTYVSKYDDSLLQRAIDVELARGGQVFVVHNRVQSIFELANRVRELVPRALVGVGHGQMAEGELEEAMMAFYQKRTNVLVCTSIIESGLDVPSANTIIVNRADAFGLAQLYQIRGRVGRGQSRAYAYLMIPAEGSITEDAKKRLEVLQKFVELGSGFSIASHDLEIRGGGDILGPQQSGHIEAVGFDLYTELLEEAIQELQGKSFDAEERGPEPEIKAPFPSFLAEEYVTDVHQRLSLYRRLSAAANESELLALEEELRDRFGALPLEAQNLLWMVRLKQLLKKLGIEGLTVGPEKVSLVPGSRSRLDPARAIALVSSQPTKFQLLPDSKLVVKIPSPTLRDLFFGLESLLQDLLPRAVS